MLFAYEYTFAEFEAINRARARRARFRLVHEGSFWLLVAFNVASGLWLASRTWDGLRDFDWLSFANLAIAVLLLAGRYVGGPWYRRWVLRQQQMEGRRVTIEIGDEGVKGTVGAIHTTVGWPDIRRADDEPRHFVLWINKMQAFSIPKAAFGDESEMDRFRHLVAVRVKDQDVLK